MKRRDSLRSSVFISCVESLLSPRLDQGLKKYLMAIMVILNLRKWFGKEVLGCVAEGIWAGENANCALVSGEKVKLLPPSTKPTSQTLATHDHATKEACTSAYFLASGYFTVML